MHPPAKTLTVRILRPFMLNGGPTTPGDVITLPGAFASEMISAGKAARANDGPTPPPCALLAPPLLELPAAPAAPAKRKAKP